MVKKREKFFLDPRWYKDNRLKEENSLLIDWVVLYFLQGYAWKYRYTIQEGGPMVNLIYLDKWNDNKKQYDVFKPYDFESKKLHKWGEDGISYHVMNKDRLEKKYNKKTENQITACKAKVSFFLNRYYDLKTKSRNYNEVVLIRNFYRKALEEAKRGNKYDFYVHEKEIPTNISISDYFHKFFIDHLVESIFNNDPNLFVLLNKPNTTNNRSIMYGMDRSFNTDNLISICKNTWDEMSIPFIEIMEAQLIKITQGDDTPSYRNEKEELLFVAVKKKK